MVNYTVNSYSSYNCDYKASTEMNRILLVNLHEVSSFILCFVFIFLMIHIPTKSEHLFLILHQLIKLNYFCKILVKFNMINSFHK
jgi:hypothetical protein